MCFLFELAAVRKVGKVMRSKVLAASDAVITPTDGALTDDTIQDGLLGSLIRTKYTSVGTYTGATNLELTAVIEQ